MARTPSRRRTAALLLATGALAAAPAVAAAQGPSPGAPDIGEPLFPGLGNGGYDVQHYFLDVRKATADPAEPIAGTVTITARATQALSRFNLDFAGGGISGVGVNGEPAQWAREDQELVVTPEHPVRDGRKFAVRVSGFSATPTVPEESFESTALIIGESGIAMAAQPNVAHYVYPSNDHPADKATFAFRLDVPAGTSRRPCGATCGSTRATPPSTTRCSPSRTASSRTSTTWRRSRT